MAHWRALERQNISGARVAVRVVAVEALSDAGEGAKRLQQRMSRAAILAQTALGALLEKAAWGEGRDEIGYFLGVGASGGSVEQFERMMAVSVEDGAWSMAKFGSEGLRACNPLYAFQLMNNFTMCHGAITHGLGGPNGALFSRGAGTWGALLEGIYALQEGECRRVVVGGADSALHPVTRLELEGEEREGDGVTLSEGAGLLALSSDMQGALPVEIVGCACAEVSAQTLDAVGAALAEIFGEGDLPRRVWMVCGTRARAELLQRALEMQIVTGLELQNLSASLGEALAATPALLWGLVVGEAQRLEPGERVWALSWGRDDVLAGVQFERVDDVVHVVSATSAHAHTSQSRANSASAPSVVISGVGAVSAFGVGVDALWDGLSEGRHGIGPIRSFDVSTFPVKVAGEVVLDQTHPLEGVSEQWSRDRKLGFGVLAADEAWKHAGCTAAQAHHTALCLGLGLEQALLDDFVFLWTGERLNWALTKPLTAGDVRWRTPVDLCARAVRARLGLGGLWETNVSACAAGALAIAQGAAWIRRGLVDRVVCGGADAMVNPMGLGGMARLGAPSPRADVDACRPFDRRRDGLVMGEGAAVFVLEREDVALARGVKPLAKVLGWGSSQDGYRTTAPRPDGLQAAKAMQAALRSAGITAQDIGYINAHGTGTPLNDPAEVAAIRLAFGAHASNLAVSSIKGAVGHLMAASGAIELAASLLCFTHDLLPGTAHLLERDPACNLDIIGPTPRAKRVDAVMSTSFGFGGQNAAVILGRCR